MATGDGCSFMGTDTEVSNVVEGKVLLRLSFTTQRVLHNMSRLMGKPTICICENKDADQLQRL